MPKKILFALMVAAQLAVPSWMIYSMESVIAKGEPWLFKTAPVDPYDLFRGRYVALGFEQGNVNYKGTEIFFSGQKVYALLEKDAEGFARVRDLAVKKPAGVPAASACLTARVLYHQFIEYDYTDPEKPVEKKVNVVQIRFPFDRFYMNETKAPEAEALYRRANEAGPASNAHAEVRVLNGRAAIRELFVNGRPAAAVLEENAASTAR